MVIRFMRLLTIVIAVEHLVLSPAAAQTPRAMTLVDLLNVPRISNPQLSPDGRDIVYVQAQADWKANKRISHLWRVAVAGGQAVQLTTGADGETTPRWSPDGKTIAFVAKRNGDEFAQIYLLAGDGGEARKLTSHATAVADIQWSPDGASVYFTAPEPKTAEQKERDKGKDDVFPFDEDFKQTHLWRAAVSSGHETRITSGDYSILDYELSHDGRRIAFQRAPSPKFGDGDQGEVWVMDGDGTHALQLTKNTVPESGPMLSPDNSRVLFLSQANPQFEIYYNRKLFVAPAAGGPAKVVSPVDAKYEIERACWSKDGRSIYFLANTGVRAELFVVPADGGQPRQLTDGNHAIEQWSVNDDRQVFIVDHQANPGEVYVMAGPSAEPTRVTHVFETLAREFKLPKAEPIQWKGADGVTVEGILYYPIDYQPGQKYPLAVQTHGGPQASDKLGFGSWGNYVQVLTGKGYAVLQPNYRGSTGYGDPFLRDMVGHYFKNAHLDVIAGVDEVIRRGIADPEKLVKMGWSGGGHMTNKIITFTDRFKAASAGAGAANWISMYAQSDVRTYRTPWFGGTPWQKNMPLEAYWNNSPLKDIANVKTPTIFLVGEKDVRVPMPQSVEMHHALKSNGIPTHLYVAPREPHGWQELRHELFKMNVELDWFEKYATHRPYVWEKAPGEKETRATTDQ